MLIQLYLYKRSFEVQRAERYLKERRIPYQTVDLKKHRLGVRELALFAKGRSPLSLVDKDQEAVKSHPIAYTSDAGRVLEYLMDRPEFLLTPILREGQRVMVGFDEALLASWIKES
ncbi:MAG: arsenate reductase family protein [Christensenellales bacterium]